MKLYHKDGYRFRVMNYLFYNCIIPARVLRFMGATTKGMQKQVRIMEKDEWIKSENNFGKKYYVVNPQETSYKEYKENYFADFEIYYMKRRKSFYRSDTSSDYSITNKQKMQRLASISESSIFLSEAGVKIFPSEKSYLHDEFLDFEQPSFYQSIEIKDVMEDEEARSMASRMTGCICHNDKIYTVYSLSDDIIKIGDITEKLMIERLNIFFSSKIGKMEVEDTFLFTWKYEKVHEKLSLQSNFGSHFYLNDNFKHYYLIPYSREGNRLTRLLLKQYAMEELMNMTVKNTWRLDRESITIDADGIDENDVYIFNYLIPDVYRLKRFLRSAAVLKDKQFHVFCYKFQEEALKNELPPNVSYAVYEFDVVEELCMKRIKRRVLRNA